MRKDTPMTDADKDAFISLVANRERQLAEAQKFLDEHEDESGSLSVKDKRTYDRMQVEIKALTNQINAELSRPTSMPFYEQPCSMLDAIFNTGTVTKGGVKGYEYRKAFVESVRNKFSRATDFLSVGQNDDGGYLLPTELNNEIVTKLQAENVLRQISKVIETESTHLFPVVAAQPAASWIGEGEEISFSNAKFGQVSLTAHKLGTSIVASNEILQDSYYNLENFLVDEFGRSLARAEEEAFLTGTGEENQPLGLLPTLAQSATSIIQTTTAEITMDDLIALIFSVDRPYRRGACFLMSDATLAHIRRLKDGTQNYLWQPSLIQGTPDKILGFDVYTSNYMPNAQSGNVPILFGEFKSFVIGDRGNRQFRPLRELYALSDKTAFLMLERVDCILTDRNAIRGLKIR